MACDTDSTSDDDDSDSDEESNMSTVDVNAIGEDSLPTMILDVVELRQRC